MTDRACGNCGVEYVPMVGMVPGRDGKAWFLCRRCWSPAPAAIVTKKGAANKTRSA